MDVDTTSGSRFSGRCMLHERGLIFLMPSALQPAFVHDVMHTRIQGSWSWLRGTGTTCGERKGYPGPCYELGALLCSIIIC
jgi:hypothetical protein